jgi:HK97 family phage portal protein
MGRWKDAWRVITSRGSPPPMPVERKHSAVGGLTAGAGGPVTWLGTPGPNWTPRTYADFAAEGYRKNVIAFRSVRTVSEGAASVPWKLFDDGRMVSEHPLLEVLDRPNPLQGGNELFETVYGHLLIAGNAYLEAVSDSQALPRELYALRPDRMKVVPGPQGWPAAYIYTLASRSHRYAVDVLGGKTPILQIKTFNPLDDFYGLSPIEAAAFGIDIHNSAGAWNKALLDNAARPSGALVFDAGDGPGSLTPSQFDRLKADLAEHYQGARNAGRPLLLEGGLKWQAMSFSPADMDFIESKHVSAREIALAFGVPPMLLGIPGDNTYANYQEANRALWRQTILPVLDKTADALNGWLAPKFGPRLKLAYDIDAIPALSAERDAMWSRIENASFLTLNEKRRAAGFGPVEGGDGPPSTN